MTEHNFNYEDLADEQVAELSAEVRRCTFNETARERINTLLSQLTEITEGKDGI